MKIVLVCMLCLMALSGCNEQPAAVSPAAPREPAPPPKGYSKLTISINQDDTSDFSFSMRSNARTPAEATEFAIKALKERMANDGKPELMEQK